MPSPRWVARLAIPIMAGAALVTSAAIATADVPDDAYLAHLRALGYTWPPDHDPAMISLGHSICFDRWTLGHTPDRIAQDVHSTVGSEGLTFGDVTNLVNAAETAYCPG
ncbi:MAG TPA: DUF732 domain-containing protein [Mycobacterium sp.]|jgi:hypothetical protein|nr:DUF732 domain-containing protein [Mycobacterium sp.]